MKFFYTSYNYLEYNKSYLFSEEVESLIIQKNVYRLILRCHRRKLAIMDINVKLTVDKLLLDKISDAMGWIAMESTPSKIATRTYIDEIKSMDIPPLEKAALINNARKAIKEYSNQLDIVKFASESVYEEITPDKIDDDWLIQFMDFGKQVSSREFQQIWGMILAKEAETPGSIPKSMLHTLLFFILPQKRKLRQMEKIFLAQIKDYEQWGIIFDKLVDLDALGLINFGDNFLSLYSLEADRKGCDVIYYDKRHNVKGSDRLNIGNVIYTKQGMALYKALSHAYEKIDGFWETICIPNFKKTEG